MTTPRRPWRSTTWSKTCRPVPAARMPSKFRDVRTSRPPDASTAAIACSATRRAAPPPRGAGGLAAAEVAALGVGERVADAEDRVERREALGRQVLPAALARGEVGAGLGRERARALDHPAAPRGGGPV